jgi:coronin-1B/1C/6
VAWNYDGNILATSCKDKQVRLLDPRTGAETAKVQAHDGSKTFKLVWLGPREKLVSVGFTRQSKRHFRVWDPRNMSKEVVNVDIDQAAGVIMPFYDEDTNLLYLAGKGDGNIRYFEMVDDTPWSFSISAHRTSKSAKGMCMLPKRSCDVMRCEVARFLKLTSRDVEPLSFIIPRKSELFQDDIFPDCRSGKPSGTATEFFSGTSKKPVLMSLDPAKRESGATTSSSAPAFKVLKSATELQAELDAANKKIAELEAKLKAAGIN